jgi:uncharacterized protein HemX
VTRALRWILLLVVLGVAAGLAFYLLQDSQESPQPQEAAAESGDQLTEEDRQGLTKLIESKKAEKEGDKTP